MTLARSPKQYTGVRPINPPNVIRANRNPLSTDKDYVKGDIWINLATPASYQYFGAGVWVLMSSAAGALNVLTGDTGGPISPSAGNINIVGSGPVSVAGAGNTLTVSASVVLVWNDKAVSGTATENTGSIFTASAVALTLPNAPPQGTVCSFFVDVAAINCSVSGTGGAKIRNISLNQTTFTAIGGQGCSLSLVYRTAGNEWCVISQLGTWG